MTPVVSKVKDAINSVGKEGNYTVIQEVGSVIYYSSPAEDITNAVKAKLNLK
jgi:Skp family chaperone for outer membrane proteins